MNALSRHPRSWPRRTAGGALLASFAFAASLQAQAAIDPNIAPRAAALEREGERPMAIDLLGRYLATAPDDGSAWLQLGRFYLADARDWHSGGHRGEPDGMLYLDFAATAFEQSIRLSVDSGVVFRGYAEVERGLVLLEAAGWSAALAGRVRPDSPAMPPYIIELGANLLSSCPAGGVLLTGNDLENLSVWYGSLESPSLDVLLVRPDRYATDSLYRRRVAEAMGVDPALPVQRALAAVAGRRRLCLSPGADSAAAPALTWVPYRLVRLSGPPSPSPSAITVTELIKASRGGVSPWVGDVREVYDRAAAHNLLLCSSLLLLYGDTPPAACAP
jgi:hypothetical protein